MKYLLITLLLLSAIFSDAQTEPKPHGLCPGGSICVTGYYIHRTPRIFNFLHKPQNRRRFINDYYKTDTNKIEYEATTQTNNTGTITISIGCSCCWIHKKPRVLNFLYQREHRRKYVLCN